VVALKQIEFAKLLGVSRSYITKLKADGRLVMDGVLVDVDASQKRIAETADLNRDDVASRWAAQRGRETGITKPETVGEPEDESIPVTGTYATARARKEHAQADIAEMERDKQRGLVIDRAAVAAAVEDVMTTVRQSIEQQPHRVAPMLVGQDLDCIRATLKQENNSALAEMVKDFGKRLRQISGEEEGN
jgi:phage terminase Nu1 subunit (DNA packaging protein)